jgi:hypothetical protein
VSENALSVYLRSVSRLYPGGIPRAAFAEARSRAVSHASAVLFLSCEPVEGNVANPFGDAAGELLRGAIEKGLKLPLSEAQVLRSADVAEIQSAFAGSAASLVVLLGTKAAEVLGVSQPGGDELVLHANKRLLCTVELSRSAKDAATKKRFWHDLQRLLPVLGTRQ